MKVIKNKVCFILGILIALGGIGFGLFVQVNMIFYGGMMTDLESMLFQFLLIGLPAFAGIVLLVAGLREEYRRRVVLVLEWGVFLVYLLILSNLLFGGYRAIAFEHSGWREDWLQYLQYSVNLIPFRSIGEYFRRFMDHSMNYDIIFQNLFGNLVLFMPMAVFLPCAFHRMYKFRCFAPVMAGVLVLVEVVQLVFRLGSLDVDDFIMNFSGAILAFGFVHIPAVKRLLQKCYLMG